MSKESADSVLLRLKLVDLNHHEFSLMSIRL